MKNTINKISIILPTYNEAENIISLIEQLERQLRYTDHEIIVVDDNSPDGTSNIVKDAKKTFPQLRLITRISDKGLVPSIREGIKSSSGDVCVWMDADLSMSPSLIKQLLKEIQEGADLAVGSRYIQGGGIKGANPEGKKTPLFKIWKSLMNSEDSFFSVMISKLGNLMLRMILDKSFHDYTSGFYAARKELLDKIEIEGKFVDYCISLPYRSIMNGFRVVEVPTIVVPRKSGQSKTSNNLFLILSISYDCLKMAISLRFYEKKRKIR